MHKHKRHETPNLATLRSNKFGRNSSGNCFVVSEIKVQLPLTKNSILTTSSQYLILLFSDDRGERRTQFAPYKICFILDCLNVTNYRRGELCSPFLYVYLLDLIILITDKMLKITKINNDTKSK